MVFDLSDQRLSNLPSHRQVTSIDLQYETTDSEGIKVIRENDDREVSPDNFDSTGGTKGKQQHKTLLNLREEAKHDHSYQTNSQSEMRPGK